MNIDFEGATTMKTSKFQKGSLQKIKVAHCTLGELVYLLKEVRKIFKLSYFPL